MCKILSPNGRFIGEKITAEVRIAPALVKVQITIYLLCPPFFSQTGLTIL